MSENKHTPGPWRVGPVDDTVVTDATGREVAAIDGDYNDPDTWPAMEANARLIAAAPDLLAALKQVEREMRAGFGSSFGETREQVRRAIARAEGSATRSAE